MKILKIIPIFFIVLLFTSIESQEQPAKTVTLRSVFEKANEELKTTKEELIKELNTADRSCVKEKLKLDTSGSKTFNEQPAQITVACGFFLCLKNPKSIIDGAIEELTKNQDPHFKAFVDCFAKELIKIDPEMKLVKNLDQKTLNFTQEFCASQIKEFGIERLITSIETEFEKLDKATCGIITENDLKKVGFGTLILKFASYNADMLKDGKEELKEMALKKTTDTCNCLIGKI